MCNRTLEENQNHFFQRCKLQSHFRGNFWNSRTSEGRKGRHASKRRRCSCTIERIFGTPSSSKDKRRTSHTHPNLVQAQQLVICLLLITSTAHIRAVLIAPQPVSIKHSSRSSFANPFTSTTHHYGLFWSMHSQMILASRIIHATATLGSLPPVHIQLGEFFSSYIFFNPSIQYVKSCL